MREIDKIRELQNESSVARNYEIDKLQRKIENGRYIASHIDWIVNDLDIEFEKITKLNNIDMKFLFLATALQCCRQYLLSNFKERENDQDAAKHTLLHKEEHSDRKGRLYNPSLEEINTNPVPFDTTFGAKDIGAEIAKHGGHRYTVLGHDPVLGWIFGTANIATSTLTDYKFHSYHIRTGQNKAGSYLDKVTKNASTIKVMYYTKEKLLNEGPVGKQKIAASLLWEAVHLASDVRTKDSLPFPAISVLKSPELAEKVANYKIDQENLNTIAKQASYAILINSIIAMIHRLLYDEKRDISEDLYNVRTRKIIMYSNIIASSSNILLVAIGASYGVASGNAELVKKSIRKLDVGGFLITMYRLINDTEFIDAIKKEFIINNLNGMIENNYEGVK